MIGKSTLYNYIYGTINQLFPLLVFLLTAPMIIRFFGEEAFGYYSYFMLYQALISLLEVGLGAGLLREATTLLNAKSCAIRESSYNSVKSVEALILAFSGFLMIAICFTNLPNIVLSLAEHVSTLILAASSMRLPQLIYRNFFQGAERHDFLAVFTVLSLAVKYVLSLFAALFFLDFKSFFGVFIFCSLVELIFLKSLFELTLKSAGCKANFLFFNWADLRRLLPYTSALAFSAFLWALVSQGDRVILSQMWEPEFFGNYFLVSSVAAALIYLSAPLSQITLPKWINFFNENKHELVQKQFQDNVTFLLSVFFAIACCMVLYAETMFGFFGGGEKLIYMVDTYLPLMLIIHCFTLVGTLTLNAQIAYADTRFHAIGALISAVLQITCTIICLKYFDVLYMLKSLCVLRLSWFLFWTSFVLRRVCGWNFIKMVLRVGPKIAIFVMLNLAISIVVVLFGMHELTTWYFGLSAFLIQLTVALGLMFLFELRLFKKSFL